MRRRLSLDVVLCLASLMISPIAFAEPAHRPIEEMRGGCSDYAMELHAELAAMQGPVRTAITAIDRSKMAPLEPAGQALSAELHQAGQVDLTAVPRKGAGSYAGIISLSVPHNGHYRISAASPVWIEILADRERIDPQLFEMQVGCNHLFKSFEYELRAGRRYWVELSANAPSITILWTRR